jgi:hypothetical protein
MTKKSVVALGLVVTVLLSLWLVSAQSAQPTLQPVDRLMVVDSQGRVVGPVIGVAADGGAPLNAYLSFRVNHLVTVLRVFPSGFYDITQPSMFFQSVDCSGAPYMQTFESGAWPQRTAVAFPGSTLYVSSGGVASTVAFRSISNEPGVCVPLEGESEALPASRGPDLSTHFTPPFSLR